MTYIEKYMAEHPQEHDGSVMMWDCPIKHFDGFKRPDACEHNDTPFEICKRCWHGEYVEEKSTMDKMKEMADALYPEPKPINNLRNDFDDIPMGPSAININEIREMVGLKPIILDSGNRREFETGAVRDIQEGKGRCDLMPLDVVAEFRGRVLESIAKFQEDGHVKWLQAALHRFIDKYYDKDMSTAFLECAKHFEDGAKKYGESNWQKGIPTHCYIDSAVRHYLKFLRGDKDEPHDRAFVWNLLCCIWTCKHKPELNDYAKKDK